MKKQILNIILLEGSFFNLEAGLNQWPASYSFVVFLLILSIISLIKFGRFNFLGRLCGSGCLVLDSRYFL